MADQSYLSRDKYGYDFVVSTTQASINSGLLNVLENSKQQATSLCFCADQLHAPSIVLTLEEFCHDKGVDVNPFEIPANASYNDKRVQTLYNARFVVGVKIRMGLPKDILPKALPPVVNLNSNDSVGFNMFCSELTVVHLVPGAYNDDGSWHVWNQPADEAWYFGASVNLLAGPLSKTLDDVVYFDKRPAEKQAILRQLSKFSSNNFSLQQILYDLENSALVSDPVINGLHDGSPAKNALKDCFINVYAKHCREEGLPLFGIAATLDSDKDDPSKLQMTDFQRQITLLKDKGGHAIKDPTPTQLAVTTLDYLCVANNKPMPGRAEFNWSWVQPQEVDTESGVIAINRNTVSGIFFQEILPAFQKSWVYFEPWVKGENVNSMYPTVKIYSHNDGNTGNHKIIGEPGSHVIHYSNQKHKVDTDHWNLAWYAESQITTEYTADVHIVDSAVQIYQHYKVRVYLQIAATSCELNVYDCWRRDTYDLSVGQQGNLCLEKRSKSDSGDDSEDPDRSWLVNLFTHINDMIKVIKNDIGEIQALHLAPVQFDKLQAFVFPASKTFTFKHPTFSEFQDLVCQITYVDPSAALPTQAQLYNEAKDQGHTLLEGDFPSQNDLKLTYSTELMDNYVQGEIVAPCSKFEALQTGDGHALLFAMDSSSVFHVIKEQSGTSSNGWHYEDLSSPVLERWYTEQADVAKVRTFDVGQSAVNGSIDLALAVSCGDFDTLFVSLGNGNTNTDWTSNPPWKRIPFDDVSETLETLRIVNVMFVETSKKEEFLVVDIDRPSSSSSNQRIARYHIDLSKMYGSYWVKHDVPVDIESGNYQSVVGRVKNGRVDGVYTAGFTGGTPQLAYVPLENIYGSGPPMPRRLSLPDTKAPHPIAAARYGDPSSDFLGLTDLFCIGGSTLYRYAADQQLDGSKAVPLVTSDCLSGSDQLQVTMDDEIVTLCGKNGSNELFYTSCPVAQVSMPGSWSAVVPILEGVERFSTYINTVDGANTVFASGGGKLFKLAQSSATGAKIWRVQEIALAAPPTETPLVFNSYTTTLHVTDLQDLPAREGVELEISADAMTPFYINGLSYLVGPKPVRVPTNSAGIVNVVEAAAGLNATVLTVSIRHGPTSTIVNPMQKAFDKLSALNSETALRGASIPAETTAGGTLGPTTHASLVEPSTNAEDLKTIAANMGGLRKAWDEAKLPFFTGLARLDLTSPRVLPATTFLGYPKVGGFWDSIAVAAGDLFRWLKTGVEAVLELIQDAATAAWHFIAKIAGKVYRAVLDTVEAIVGAIEWVFEKIKTGIEKLIQYVKFLFAWSDIRRTKDALHRVTALYLRHQMGQLGFAKTAFDGHIGEARKTLHQWAGIDDWSALGDAASKPASGSARSPSKGQTSASMLFASHYRDNAQRLTVVDSAVDSLAFKAEVEGVIEAFLETLLSHGDVLSGLYSDLKTLAPKIPQMSVTEILKAFGALLADGMLLSTQAVVDALLDTLVSIGDTVLDIMNTKIHIPVISDILKWIGVPPISFLDLFLWIGAVSCDVVYKIIYGEAPFPDTAEVNAIISAKSWDALVKMFGAETLSIQAAAASGSTNGTMKQAKASGGRDNAPRGLSRALQQVIYITGHATAGFCLFMGDFVVGLEAEALTGENPFSIPAAVLGAMAALLDGAAGILAPAFPVENVPVRVLAGVATFTTIAAKVLFSGYLQKQFAAADSRFSGLAVGDGRATGAVVGAVLVVPQLFVTGWHFYELSQTGGGGPAHTAAVLGEVARLTGYASALCYAAAVNDEDPASRQVPIVTLLALNVATGGLQTAEAFQVEKARREGMKPVPDEQHKLPAATHQVPGQGTAVKTRDRLIESVPLKGGSNRWSEKTHRFPPVYDSDPVWDGGLKGASQHPQGTAKLANGHTSGMNGALTRKDTWAINGEIHKNQLLNLRI